MSEEFSKSYSKTRKSMGYGQNKNQFGKGFQSPPKVGSKPMRQKANATVPIVEAKRSKSRSPRRG